MSLSFDNLYLHLLSTACLTCLLLPVLFSLKTVWPCFGLPPISTCLRLFRPAPVGLHLSQIPTNLRLPTILSIPACDLRPATCNPSLPTTYSLQLVPASAYPCLRPATGPRLRSVTCPCLRLTTCSYLQPAIYLRLQPVSTCNLSPPTTFNLFLPAIYNLSAYYASCSTSHLFCLRLSLPTVSTYAHPALCLACPCLACLHLFFSVPKAPTAYLQSQSHLSPPTITYHYLSFYSLQAPSHLACLCPPIATWPYLVSKPPSLSLVSGSALFLLLLLDDLYRTQVQPCSPQHAYMYASYCAAPSTPANAS